MFVTKRHAVGFYHARHASLRSWRLLLYGCLFGLASIAGESPVSYGRQIAPLFALNCAGCHGLSNPSSNFRVTQFAALRAGGNIGDDIVPGHPETSALLDFLEGRRGASQRMPQNSAPLRPEQITLIRRWIREGAQNDGAKSSCFEMRVPAVALSSAAPLQIRARISSPAFLVLSLRAAAPVRDLYLEEASVNAPKEAANIAAPGEWIRWSLRRERDWPSSADVILRLHYSSRSLDGSVLTTKTGGAKEQRISEFIRSTCSPL